MIFIPIKVFLTVAFPVRMNALLGKGKMFGEGVSGLR
jgi:hypothetical protein